jgi:hypothetical protein
VVFSIRKLEILELIKKQISKEFQKEAVLAEAEAKEAVLTEAEAVTSGPRGVAASTAKSLSSDVTVKTASPPSPGRE